ncbi:MAG: mechanosensitive ion channel family protein [Candidatus Omnitrophica bacterium]|nr:mechanosensitive ion channel family protein [Candidatus Omnitrophota bacterium]MCA9426498.1 mechanosensitive ion channel family protein [Candidatus Omnitrophota bacterium]MCA9430078.1 mechanosensitive ion channel family protein [Candidatus Omnitrophota bacterium]MCB9768660.1 mechanosensitive ion channel family protein [Candidatus Omnitrophota bacterium]MCB9783544.1 mechanosensitive ion channel family protein [Candidatus Omnitrophota bacterium]
MRFETTSFFAHLLILLLFATGVAHAQDVAAPAGQPAPATAAIVQPPPVPKEHQSPRATMKTFLEAMRDAQGEFKDRNLKKAVDCLNLSGVAEDIRLDFGTDRAVMIKEVMDRIRYINVYAISSATDAEPYRFLERDEGEIVIDKADNGEWLFTQRTVETIPDLYRIYEDREKVFGVTDSIQNLSPSLWLRSKFPSYLKQPGFLLEYWQWISLVCLIAIGYLLQRIIAWVLNMRVMASLKKRPGWQNLSPKDTQLGRPLGIFFQVLFWWVCLRFLGLPATAYDLILDAAKVMATLAGVSFGLKAVNVGTDLALMRAMRTDNKFDDLLVPLVKRILKTLVFVTAILVLANFFGEDLTGLLAGLGLGGLAFALAAKDILGNLFGSLTVLMDRPFHIGDWIVVEGVEGTVEEVGFRSTRVRTFYNSLVTIPNSILTTTPVDNYGAREYRRTKTYLSVTYDTPPDKIEAFCEGIRELVRLHPDTRKDYFHVYLNQFSASSLDILLYVFFKVPDWGAELKARNDFFLGVLRLAEELGVEFAFPTQTLHLHQEEDQGPETGMPPANTREAHRLGREAAKKAIDRLPGVEKEGNGSDR